MCLGEGVTPALQNTVSQPPGLPRLCAFFPLSRRARRQLSLYASAVDFLRMIGGQPTRWDKVALP